jgi:dTDP-4-amino-4,6-dideoxygalactose transaminase
MNEIEAAVGIGSLKMYEQIIKERRHNLLTMMERFKKFGRYITTIREENDEKIGPHAFPMVVRERAGFSRDQFVDYLERNGIDTRDLFTSMPTQCAGFAFLGHKLGDFPNAEYIGNNGLHIGVHQDLHERHIDYFIHTVEKFLYKHGKKA